MNSSDGIRSLYPPNGARSRFTKPLRSRTLRLYVLVRDRQQASTFSSETASRQARSATDAPHSLHHPEAHGEKLAVDANHGELVLDRACVRLTWRQINRERRRFLCSASRPAPRSRRPRSAPETGSSAWSTEDAREARPPRCAPRTRPADPPASSCNAHLPRHGRRSKRSSPHDLCFPARGSCI